MNEPRDIILRTIELLHSKGWIQHQESSPEGFCVLGAMGRSADQLGTPRGYLALAVAMDQVYSLLDVKFIPTWNDAPGRTKAEVIALLTRAAEIGEPEKRRVLIPNEVPTTPLSPNSPLWTDPTIPEPNPVKVPERVPA